MGTNDPTGWIWTAFIEGIGEEGADASNGQRPILLSTGAAQEHIDRLAYRATAIDWRVEPHLSYTAIGNPETDLDFFEASNRWSRADLLLEATDYLTERLLHRSGRALFVTTSQLAVGDTSIDTDADAGQLENTTIYVDDETIKLGSHSGSGTYSIDTRAAFVSDETPHSKGSNIYQEQPHWSGRRVTITTYKIGGGPDFDSSGNPASRVTLQSRWRGRVSSKVKQFGGDSQSAGKLVLECTQLLQVYQSYSAGKKDRSLQGVTNPDPTWKPVASGDIALSTNIVPSSEYEPKIVKADTGQPHFTESGGSVDVCETAVQVGKNLIAGAQVTTDSSGSYKKFGVWDYAHYDIQEEDVEAPENPRPRDASEVLCFDRFGNSLGVRITPLLSLWKHFGNELYGFHPMALYGAIHLSTPDDKVDPGTFNIFKADWNLGMKSQFVSGIVDDLKTLIENTPRSLIDELVWGESNQKVKIREKALNQLVRGYGFAEGITNDGYLFVERQRYPTIEDIDEARDNPIQIQNPSKVLEESSGRDSTTDAVELLIGGATPATDSRSVLVTAADPEDETLSAGKVDEKPSYTIDLTAVSPQRLREARNKIVARVLTQHFDIPRLTARFDDFVGRAPASSRFDDLQYGIGQLFELQDLRIEPGWFVEQGGNRTRDISGKASSVGFIKRSKMITTEERGSISYELELLLLGDRPIRWRAPSGILRGSTTDAENNTILKFEPAASGGSAGSVFGDTVSDAARFTEDDEVELWTQDLTRWTDNEIKTVLLADPSNNQIKVAGPYNSAPPQGLVCRLAYYDSDQSGKGYQNQGLSGTYSNVDRLYVFLSDLNETIGDADLKADEYGS